MQAQPEHILAAPSHPQPYGWYAELRQARPLFFDEALGVWVASGAERVRSALLHPDLRVRPPAEPVPQALRGTAVGEVFAQLVRMNDGAFHARHRPDVVAAIRLWDERQVAAAADAAARDLGLRIAPDALLSALPVQAMARLLGVPAAELDATVDWVHAFTAGIAPSATPDAVAQADAAADALMAQGEREGLATPAAANRIALMQQSLDATAGLIGNAIHACQREPQSLAGTHLVERVARQDPAIHNTRRFAASDLELAGVRIRAGQCVVLVLADPDAELGFGGGAHACPGERVALQIAAAALRSLEASGALGRFGPVQGYRPLPNARIPVFAERGT
jgi:cytochrome P450